MAGPEIISTVAAILQLVGYGVQVSSRIAELAKKARNQSEILEDLAQQVKCIIDSAERIRSTSSQTSLTDSATRQCIDKAMALQTRVTAWRMEILTDGRTAKRHRILGVATWSSKEKEIANLWKEIEQSMKLLNFQASCKTLEESQMNRGTITASVGVGLSSSSLSTFSRISIDFHDAVQVSPAMDSTLPPRDVDFVGKEELLKDLEQRRRPGSRVAIVGLGGIGKTQLVIEYAHRFRRESRGLCIFFASAHSELHLEQSYSTFAVDARLTSADTSFTSKCRAVKDFLESSQATGWLMIIDGGDDEETFYGTKKLHQLLPERINGSILFTSRSLQLALEFVRNDEIIYLNQFSPDESITLLRSRLGALGDNSQDLLELAELLEGLPLALSQASSFIATCCGTVQDYVRLYRKSEASKLDLLGEGRSHRDGSAVNPVTTTWQISFVKVKEKNPLAAHLLYFSACLHYHLIPLELFSEAYTEAKLAAALGVLKNHFLITLDTPGKSFSMHSLVHLTTRHWMGVNELDDYTQIVYDSLYQHFPSEFQHQDQLRLGERYCAHVQTVLGRVQSDGNSERFAQLSLRMSLYLRVKGNYGNAFEYAKTATDLSTASFGHEALLTLNGQSELVITNRYLGNYQEAERLAVEVLKLREQMLGDEHQDTLVSKSSLAVILHRRGKYADAEQLHRQIVDTRVRISGPMHHDTIKSLSNLGLSLRRQGKLEDAKAILLDAFSKREETLGAIKISTLKVMNNLGLVFQHLEDHQGALNYLTAAFEGKRALFGSKHPDTLRSKLNVANSLSEQGHYANAEPMVREVIGDCASILGDDHPDTLFARSVLIAVLQGQGRYREAVDLNREVHEARKAKLGDTHPDTLFSGKKSKELRDCIWRTTHELD